MASLITALRTEILLLLALFSWPLALADVQAPSELSAAEIKTLLQLNGVQDTASQLGHAMGQGVIAELHRSIPNLPARADAVVSNTVEAYVRERASHDSVIDILVPIYAKYLTKSDVEGLIAFYKSPVGRKLAAVTPAVSFESTKAGQQWAAAIVPGLQLKLQEVLRSEKLIP